MVLMFVYCGHKSTIAKSYQLQANPGYKTSVLFQLRRVVELYMK